MGDVRARMPHLSDADIAGILLAVEQRLSAGDLREAEGLCRRILRARPDHPATLYFLGVIALRADKPAVAVELLSPASVFLPGEAKIHYHLGVALKLEGRSHRAEAAFQQAIALAPGLAEAHYMLGVLRLQQKDHDAAIASFHRALKLRPDLKPARFALVRAQVTSCDWRELDQAKSRLLQGLSDSDGDSGEVPEPWDVLTLPVPVTAAEHQIAARAAVRSKTAALAGIRGKLGFKHTAGPRKHLRIGYLSSDFRDHATSHLIGGLFGRHDRRQVEVFAYSTGPNDGSAYRRRIEQECDAFVDLARERPVEAATRIHRDRIDILVDLNGHLIGDSLPVLCLRPAPIQVNYLGYPGTIGADFVDYILTDRIVTPRELQPFFDECFVSLPNNYQVNDRDKSIGPRGPSRVQCGLPGGAFVFCCFNQSYKIGPEVFDRWMRILRRVDDSVLWLMGTSEAARRNLCAEADRRGVSRERLVFAPRLSVAEHLARHRHADLFLDTQYCNAHTTASDALWGGLPVLTCPGETFASRVGASLLRAVGLPELSVPGWGAYEETAVRLAQHPDELQRIKEKLEANRLTTPLFDTARFARNLERAYRMMWTRFERGEPPSPFAVTEEDGLIAGELRADGTVRHGDNDERH